MCVLLSLKAFCGLLWHFLSPFLHQTGSLLQAFSCTSTKGFLAVRFATGQIVSILPECSAATLTACSPPQEEISLVPERKGKTAVYFLVIHYMNDQLYRYKHKSKGRSVGRSDPSANLGTAACGFKQFCQKHSCKILWDLPKKSLQQTQSYSSVPFGVWTGLF